MPRHARCTRHCAVMVETQRELPPAYAIRGEVSLPLQRHRTRLSRRHGVQADSPGRPAGSGLPDRASSTVRLLSALPLHVHRAAGKLARAGWEEGANRGRECQPCAGRPCTEALGNAVPPAHQSPLTEGRGVREPLAARRRRSGATLDLFSLCSRRRREQCSCRPARPSAAARSLCGAPTATSSAFTRTPNVGVRSRLGTCSAPCAIARHFSLDGQERRSLATAWLVYARGAESVEFLEARKRISEEAVAPLTAKLPKPPRSGVRAADFYRTGAPSPALAMQHGERGVRAPLATRRWLSGATLLLLFFWVGLLSPPARADVSPSLRCRAGTVFMRTDSKICPTERGRPVAAVQRACCQGRNGKIRCVHYPQCPPRSPS